MRYQSKSVGKMADFETLTLCISLNSSQMCTYFCKDSVTEYCPYLARNSIATVIHFRTDFITHTLLLLAFCHMKFVYRLISQMMYQAKSVGKMADFETLILCTP